MKKLAIYLLPVFLAACSQAPIRQTPPPAPPATQSTSPAPTTNESVLPSNSTQKVPESTATKPGGYYLDDGPEAVPPKNIDNIPDAEPKPEPLLERSNKPYVALGSSYTPMTRYKPFTQKGVASWYGKRFHGKKTASGEIYDMYAMTAAHPTLPLPSYVKVINPANNKSVVVRINDRGPFAKGRIIDLSYAAAYKLRYVNKGSTPVEIESIDNNNIRAVKVKTTVPENQSEQQVDATITQQQTSATMSIKPAQDVGQTDLFYVQAGAFKNETNANNLANQIQRLAIAENAGINNVYNDGLYRLKLGPFSSRLEADQVAAEIRKQLNLSAIITNN
jgi:rare lipoprotein A